MMAQTLSSALSVGGLDYRVRQLRRGSISGSRVVRLARVPAPVRHLRRHPGIRVAAAIAPPSPAGRDEGVRRDGKEIPREPYHPFPEFPDWDPTEKVPQGVTPGTAGLPFATVPEMWAHLAENYPDHLCWSDVYHKPALKRCTFREAHALIGKFSAGLHALGLQRGEVVSLFAETSHRWCVADQATMMNGAVIAVRGSHNTPTEELEFILSQSGSVGVIVEDAECLASLLPKIHDINQGQPVIRFIVNLWGDLPADLNLPPGVKALTFDGVLEAADALHEPMEFYAAYPKPSDMATMVYTSGTTGESPKEGVVLTHANLMYQVGNLGLVVDCQPGESCITLLPLWHIYERSAMYFRNSRAVHHIFSNVRRIRLDLHRLQPDYFCTVPLVLQTLCNKTLQSFEAVAQPMKTVLQVCLAASKAYIRNRRIVFGLELDHCQKPFTLLEKAIAFVKMALMKPFHELGHRLFYAKVRAAIGIKKSAISGGGSLAKGLDDFYEIMGMEVLNGWGLTETSPVLCCRRSVAVSGDRSTNIRGTVGMRLPATEIRVVDPDTRQDLPDGTRGLILCRGPGVMRSHLGYYRNTEANAAAFVDGDEWFDTGDLGFLIPDVPGTGMAGQLVLTGRQKDTIVLSNGENIEPQPIEDACVQSPYVKQIMVVGQDQKHLAALVVPDNEALKDLEMSPEQIRGLLASEILKFNRERGSYRPDENIIDFRIVEEGFTHENGMLSNTMKIKRFEVMAVHGNLVSSMFHDEAPSM